MGNLHQIAESNLAYTLEDYVNGFGTPVELMFGLDGVAQIYSANDTAVPQTKLLAGQVVSHTIELNSEGMNFISNVSAVTLRRSSLVRIPLSTEKHQWYVKAPEPTNPMGPKQTYLMDEATEGGEDQGMITLRLIKAAQQ